MKITVKTREEAIALIQKMSLSNYPDAFGIFDDLIAAETEQQRLTNALNVMIDADSNSLIDLEAKRVLIESLVKIIEEDDMSAEDAIETYFLKYTL